MGGNLLWTHLPEDTKTANKALLVVINKIIILLYYYIHLTCFFRKCFVCLTTGWNECNHKLNCNLSLKYGLLPSNSPLLFVYHCGSCHIQPRMRGTYTKQGPQVQFGLSLWTTPHSVKLQAENSLDKREKSPLHSGHFK